MLDKFCLNYNRIKIKTEKGLVQSSTLSPLLFNLFINNLLNLLEKWGIETRAYADDIAWIWKNVQQWQEAIRIMKSWADENAMKINPIKSGILRILLKKSKIKKSKWIRHSRGRILLLSRKKNKSNNKPYGTHLVTKIYWR